MQKLHLIITSIAGPDNAALQEYARQSAIYGTGFIVIGDTKSPADFTLPNCDFYSVEQQRKLPFSLAGLLPVKHYARKNLGYLIAAKDGADVIVETDDDNFPYPDFWERREKMHRAHCLKNKSYVNAYRYFTDENVWPRGFPLEHIHDEMPELPPSETLECMIQQGLADDSPDVDAIFRLVSPVAVKFRKRTSVAFGASTICPFNSQNTTWFREAFPLMYLPSYCSFRMTDIWRSFVAQRICWANGWNVLFHNATVWQERNSHNLMHDFADEIQGYLNNGFIMQALSQLDLKTGIASIPENLLLCYGQLIRMNLIDAREMELLKAWIDCFRTLDMPE
jgi:hypothetical protein